MPSQVNCWISMPILVEPSCCWAASKKTWGIHRDISILRPHFDPERSTTHDVVRQAIIPNSLQYRTGHWRQGKVMKGPSAIGGSWCTVSNVYNTWCFFFSIRTFPKMRFRNVRAGRCWITFIFGSEVSPPEAGGPSWWWCTMVLILLLWTSPPAIPTASCDAWEPASSAPRGDGIPKWPASRAMLRKDVRCMWIYSIYCCAIIYYIYILKFLNLFYIYIYIELYHIL